MHIKCINLNFIDYLYLHGNDDPWFCIRCNSELFPFGTLNSSNIQNKNNDDDDDNFSDLVLKPLPNLSTLLIDLITHLKPMTSKTLKMLVSVNITI